MDVAVPDERADREVAMQSPDFPSLAAKLRQFTLAQKVAMRLLDDLRWFFAILRRVCPVTFFPPKWFTAIVFSIWPNARIRQNTLVTRYEDVMEVLGRDRDFPAPYSASFESLDRTGENFLLAMKRDEKYCAIHAEAMKIFRRSDLPRIAAFSARRAEALVANGHGKVDSMAGLLTQVPVDIIGDYFGVRSNNPDFALWLMAMSGASFRSPEDTSDLRRAGLSAAKNNVGPLVDETILRAKAAPPDDDTIVGRFVAAQRDVPDVLTDDVIRATIVGFMLGFVPTNNLASGRIMEWLLRYPDVLAVAVSAAQSGDDDLLGRVLFEALRFHPIPPPGRFRLCPRDTRIAAGTPRETTIRGGTNVFASTLSAAFDPLHVPHPHRFDPYRSVADTMRFGWGQHWCIGFGIAIAQMTQTFKPLLRRGGLQRAPGKQGQPAWFAIFYEHLFVTYRQ
jgi:cytochrome P450